MSRSFRRPYAAITGTASAKSDKQLAHRGVRRKQNLTIKTCLDFENLLLPHVLECPWNNTWSWGAMVRSIISRSMRAAPEKRFQPEVLPENVCASRWWALAPGSVRVILLLLTHAELANQTQAEAIQNSLAPN